MNTEASVSHQFLFMVGKKSEKNAQTEKQPQTENDVGGDDDDSEKKELMVKTPMRALSGSTKPCKKVRISSPGIFKPEDLDFSTDGDFDDEDIPILGKGIKAVDSLVAQKHKKHSNNSVSDDSISTTTEDTSVMVAKKPTMPSASHNDSRRNGDRPRRATKSHPILTESTPRAMRMSQIFRSTRDSEAFKVDPYDSDMDITDIIQANEANKDIEHGSNSFHEFDKSTSTTTTFRSSSARFYFDNNAGMEENKPEEKKVSFYDRMKRKSRNWSKELMRFKVLKMFQVLLAFYVGFLTYADIGPPGGLRDTETGLIVDQNSQERTEKGLILVNGVERAIVASTQFQVICIGITRMSAFFMYPALVMVFISKFRATTSFLSKTPLSMFMYKDSHELHVYCGWTILIFSTIHSVIHIARWAQQGNLYLLFMHFSGVSGLFIILSCLLICIPMTIFRAQIRYEIRKNLHYLFIVFAVALLFHTPASAIPNGGFTSWVFAIIISWYCADTTYCYFFMTEKIDTTKFSVLPCGVRMTMAVSERFQAMGDQGGICYVCLPWIDKNQWHAFSLFENPTNPGERQIFIQKTGDWTTQVHRVLQRETVRPAWVHGPFPSPYDNAVSYDNQILVASGIGITPALSVIRAHKDSRRINLVWAVRDEALLEFFLNHLYLDHEGWNIIFYTGKKKLRDEVIQIESDTNVCIIAGRPNLGELIPNIIYGVESGIGLPENYVPDEDVPIGFRPWNYHEGTQRYVKNLDRNMVIPTWGMLYCGGAKPVLDALEEISDEYEIGLHVESFAW